MAILGFHMSRGLSPRPSPAERVVLHIFPWPRSAQDLLRRNTLIALAILLCSSVSLRAQISCGSNCEIYDSAHYGGSGLAAKMAFVNAVQAMGAPLGQESFSPSNFPAGPYFSGIPLPGGVALLANDIVSNGPIPAGNNAEDTYTVMGVTGISDLYYIGFDFDIKPRPNSNPANVVVQVGIDYDSVTYSEPLGGFFGVVSSSSQPLNHSGISVFGITDDGASPENVGEVYLDNILYAGGPGISASNPLYPDSSSFCGEGAPACIFLVYIFELAAYFDPVTANTYIYQTLNGALFTSVGGFPSGFSSPFDVSSGGTNYGLFGPGETLTFPGGGVSHFTISGISPSVNGSSPTAFPVELGVNTIGAQVEAIALTAPQPISTKASGLAYSRVSQTFNGTLTITNISINSITGPFQIVLIALPTGVTVANSTGSYFGNPFITVPAVASLSPGQSATVNVQFKNRSNAKINFTPVVYSGSIN